MRLNQKEKEYLLDLLDWRFGHYTDEEIQKFDYLFCMKNLLLKLRKELKGY